MHICCFGGQFLHRGVSWGTSVGLVKPSTVDVVCEQCEWLTVACVSLQGSPRCPAHPQQSPSSSHSCTQHCALELGATWCWCVPTTLLRDSCPVSSCTAWR